MQRIILIGSLVLVAGSLIVATQIPSQPGPSLPRADLRVPGTPVPSTPGGGGYKQVPIAPVYTLMPKPSPPPPSPTVSPSASPSPSESPSPSPKRSKPTPRD